MYYWRQMPVRVLFVCTFVDMFFDSLFLFFELYRAIGSRKNSNRNRVDVNVDVMQVKNQSIYILFVILHCLPADHHVSFSFCLPCAGLQQLLHLYESMHLRWLAMALQSTSASLFGFSCRPGNGSEQGEFFSTGRVDSDCQIEIFFSSSFS